MRLALLACVLGAGACHDAPPRATMRIWPGAGAGGRAVLVLPTACDPAGHPDSYCDPRTFDPTGDKQRATPSPPTFAALIDPAIRLRLELAGYTLAEAAAMLVTTSERVDTFSSSEGVRGAPTTGSRSTVTPGVSLAALPLADIVGVARTLQLSGIFSSTVHVLGAEYGQLRLQVTVEMHEVNSPYPAWTITCEEMFYDNAATTNRLGTCIGNGILAVFAPGNVMEHAQ